MVFFFLSVKLYSRSVFVGYYFTRMVVCIMGNDLYGFLFSLDCKTGACLLVITLLNW